jgi:hypothetical protein
MDLVENAAPALTEKASRARPSPPRPDARG